MLEIVEAKVIITADLAPCGENHIPLKKKVDEALDGGTSIQHVLVARRTGEKVNMKENRDKHLEEVHIRTYTCTVYICHKMISTLLPWYGLTNSLYTYVCSATVLCIVITKGSQSFLHIYCVYMYIHT